MATITTRANGTEAIVRRSANVNSSVERVAIFVTSGDPPQMKTAAIAAAVANEKKPTTCAVGRVAIGSAD
jgi:hypothetical protein